jgi:uncharacterized protein YlaI
MKKKVLDTQICNECGESVKWQSGRFVNRVLDFNTFEDRVEQGKPFPRGEYICPECDENLSKLVAEMNHFKKNDAKK